MFLKLEKRSAVGSLPWLEALTNLFLAWDIYSSLYNVTEKIVFFIIKNSYRQFGYTYRKEVAGLVVEALCFFILKINM